MQLDAYGPWSTAAVTPFTAYDLESVVTHELGHALGLDHSNVAGAVMLPTLGKGQQGRVPTADDIAGVRALYGEQPTATATTPASTPTPTTPVSTTTTATATTTATVSPSATGTPRVLQNVRRVVEVARDAPAATATPTTPKPTATATSTPTPTATTPAPTAVPTTPVPAVVVSEIDDGDEPEVLFNDIRHARVTASATTITVELQSWSPLGFSFYDNGLGDESYIAMRFYFGSTAIGAEDRYIVIHPNGTNVYNTSGGDFTSIYRGTFVRSGAFLTFSFPRSLLPSGSVAWDVTGAEARFFPRCTGGSCFWFDYDRAPEILAPKPRFTAP
jgi:hypothetical protein